MNLIPCCFSPLVYSFLDCIQYHHELRFIYGKGQSESFNFADVLHELVACFDLYCIYSVLVFQSSIYKQDLACAYPTRTPYCQ